MKVKKLELEGLLLFETPIYRDSRGFFLEHYHQEKLAVLGFHEQFVQDNHSNSIPNVIRGLHLQLQPQQGKLIRCIRGKIWDVAVDLRKNSPTYKKHFALELSADKGELFWVPPGFAHGFCVLGDEPVDVFYKCTAPYNPKTEIGIRWNDPELAVAWPTSAPLVSERDQKLPLFRDIAPQLP